MSDTEAGPTFVPSPDFPGSGDVILRVFKERTPRPTSVVTFDPYARNEAITQNTGATTTINYNFYDQRVLHQQVFANPPQPRSATATLSSPAEVRTPETGRQMVRIESVLLVGGLILLVLTVGAIFGNAVSAVPVMHPFLVVIVGIAGGTFIAMSRAKSN